jgi:tRNA G18 (ribose-2'-O)-methylase SpoU
MKEHTKRPEIDLIVDGISDPRNVPALLSLADLLGCRCLFRDRHGLRAELAATPLAGRMVEAPPLESWRESYERVLAIENHPTARSIYDYRPPHAGRSAMVVGNERRGLDRKIGRITDVMLEIPMRPRPGISLNVASAAAAALYQLLFAAAPKRHKRTHGVDRPALIFWEPRDAADLGSSLRTAYALGWDRASVVDRHSVWFGADRPTLSQGRGAARRHKTPIRVRALDPSAPEERFEVIFLVAPGGGGTPVWQMRLPAMESCALLFAQTPIEAEAVAVLAHDVVHGCITEDTVEPVASPLRLVSAITLAEVGRVVHP